MDKARVPRFVWEDGDVEIVKQGRPRVESNRVSDVELTDDMRAYAQEQECVWRTIRGRRVCIRLGETPTQAVQRSIVERAKRAKASHKPETKEKQLLAAQYEQAVADHIGGKNLDDHEPFDVIKGGRHAVEVKVVIDGAHPKITMHPSSLARKADFLRDNQAVGHTVAIDVRGGLPIYYYRRGVGSFRLSAMQKVTTKQLRDLII